MVTKSKKMPHFIPKPFLLLFFACGFLVPYASSTTPNDSSLFIIHKVTNSTRQTTGEKSGVYQATKQTFPHLKVQQDSVQSNFELDELLVKSLRKKSSKDLVPIIITPLPHMNMSSESTVTKNLQDVSTYKPTEFSDDRISNIVNKISHGSMLFSALNKSHSNPIHEISQSPTHSFTLPPVLFLLANFNSNSTRVDEISSALLDAGRFISPAHQELQMNDSNLIGLKNVLVEDDSESFDDNAGHRNSSSTIPGATSVELLLHPNATHLPSLAEASNEFVVGRYNSTKENDLNEIAEPLSHDGDSNKDSPLNKETKFITATFKTPSGSDGEYLSLSSKTVASAIIGRRTLNRTG